VLTPAIDAAWAVKTRLFLKVLDLDAALCK
jgi:hypothetical protein